MNLLTFLGTTDYKETTYILGSQRYTTCYCPAAVAHFCRPETTLVVVTGAAQARHFEPLADQISAITRPTPVLIPDGHSEADLWRIFEALTQQVNDGDELVVDITNGFRSLPFLSFLAVAFLRLARRVKVRHIYYGAWEARNEANESPVFDLTPFVTLLDWTIATDRFTRFGDASDLASLLREGIPPRHILAKDVEAQQLRQALEQAARAMEAVSLTLRLARPLETMKASETLVATLQNVGPLVELKARPFGLLAEQMRQAYQPLALAEPLDRANWRRNLEIQLRLIKWYLDKRQVVQALTLAREWLVSVLVYHFQGDSLVDYEAARLPVENALNNEVERHKPSSRPPLQPAHDALLQQLADHREIGKVWDKLTELRNDIAHVGMKRQPRPAEKLRQEAGDLYRRLQALGQKLLDAAPGDRP